MFYIITTINIFDNTNIYYFIKLASFYIFLLGKHLLSVISWRHLIWTVTTEILWTMRLSLLSVTYVSTSLFCVYYISNLVQKMVCLQRYESARLVNVIIWLPSIFPTEILEEIENIEFNLFNNEDGSYQIIVPKLLHAVHTSLVMTGL